MNVDLDLYTDYLLTSFGQSSATGLSRLVDNTLSHDSITRFLSNNNFSGKTLWQKVKPLVREYETEDACLVFDDTIVEKSRMSESSINCYHYDHSKGRTVKGINILNCFYHSEYSFEETPFRIPVDYKIISKDIHYCDIKTKKEKRVASYTKNELFREMIERALLNGLKFKYILADSWFSSSENMRFIHRKKKYFIFDMKSNRNVVLSEKERNLGAWKRIDELNIPENTPVKVWLKDLAFPLLLVKQVFKNKDLSTGTRFLVSNDFSLSADDFTTRYKKRWSVEEYHKGVKQNAALGKSPARSVKAQSNHLFAAMMAYVKLEKMRLKHAVNHFAMKAKIYLAAQKAALKELAKMKAA